MKTRMIAIVALLSLGVCAQTATASNEFVGAVVGGGVGALIGDSVHPHGNHGAVTGGIIGAITGAAIAHNNNRGYEAPREVYYREPVHYRRNVEYYEPQPTYYRQHVEYVPQPYYRQPPVVIYTQPRHGHHNHGWGNRHHDRHDSHRNNHYRGYRD